MPKDVLVRGLNEKTLKKLKKKAAANNRSLQEELKTLLELHAGPDIKKVRSMARESIKKYKAEGRKLSDSAKDISEDRRR